MPMSKKELDMIERVKQYIKEYGTAFWDNEKAKSINQYIDDRIKIDEGN